MPLLKCVWGKRARGQSRKRSEAVTTYRGLLGAWAGAAGQVQHGRVGKQPQGSSLALLHCVRGKWGRCGVSGERSEA